MKRTSTVLAAVFAVLALAAAPATAAPSAPPAGPAIAALPAYATWIADVTEVADEAAAYLDDRLPDRSIRAAIVLDIDNTALQTQYRPGLTSPATGPVLAVARQARADGAAVFFVTARPQILGLQTEANLRSAGYTVAGLYMRPWFDTRPDQKLKTDNRIAIERLGYTIVANIGNNDSDLAGGHAERTFKLPDYDGQLG
ncbi:HAD family acid phosphatase [Spirilliplanes yamanashiensis]|uniref:Acid phosphatase n=1 Tax=Spirilliplanes yamanashiensis TaxID=42233 RepID=A0A8J4DKC6_9ACTN|nr:HAD family acid phosphatase [Spirilliplanes yamanashiensis]MDP9815661.1 putative secreted acid phosphatase [Spirilliplanes yamanashiensis]GIJ03915.1 acid phosphatase [Spirilliplanes yamanashiensis]